MLLLFGIHFTIALYRHHPLLLQFLQIPNFQCGAVSLLAKNGRRCVAGFKATFPIARVSTRGPASQAGQGLRYDHWSICRLQSLTMMLQPISGTPPPESGGVGAGFLLTDRGRASEGRLEDAPEFHDRCDIKTIQKTCSLFGLDPVIVIFTFNKYIRTILMIVMIINDDH